jgi:hypothetical protein
VDIQADGCLVSWLVGWLGDSAVCFIGLIVWCSINILDLSL